MDYKFIINGRLNALNEYIKACGTSPFKGAKLKKDNQEICIWTIRQQLKRLNITKPVVIKFDWFESNKLRDHDNVSSFGRKVIQDALVQTQVLKDDGWDEVLGFVDNFYLDRKNSRIEVLITEVGD